MIQCNSQFWIKRANVVTKVDEIRQKFHRVRSCDVVPVGYSGTPHVLPEEAWHGFPPLREKFVK